MVADSDAAPEIDPRVAPSGLLHTGNVQTRTNLKGGKSGQDAQRIERQGSTIIGIEPVGAEPSARAQYAFQSAAAF